MKSPTAPSQTTEDNRLSVKENIAYALGDTASCIYFWTFNLFLVFYYVDLWGIPATAVATIMFATRLIDAITDPIMGILADRTCTRWGKFRPYLLWMAVPFGLCGYLLFANPPLTGDAKTLYAFITYTAMILVYTAINVPYSSLLGVLSPSSKARTLASAYRMAGSYVGGLLVTIFARPLARALGGDDIMHGYQLTMAIFAVLAVVLFLLCFRYTKERVQPSIEQSLDLKADLRALFHNRAWQILVVACIFSIGFIAMRATGAVFFFKYNLGDHGDPYLFGFFDRTSVFLTIGLLGMFFGAIAGTWLIDHFEKRRLTFWLALSSALTSGAMFWVPTTNFPLLTILYLVSNFLWGPTSAYLFSMFADVADYGEHTFRRRSTGLIYAAFFFAFKTGSMLAGTCVPLLLNAFGFIPDTLQSPETLAGIAFTFALLPAIFGVLKAIMIRAYPLDDSTLLKIEADLAARRN